MKEIEFYRVPETVAVIRNWYTPEELAMVWQELDVVCSPFIMYRSGMQGNKSAQENGVDLKLNHGLFLDDLYENGRRELSNILNLRSKIYNEELCAALIKEDPSFTYYINCNSDFTLVSYYDQDGKYGRHRDNSVYTANIVLWREPKKFEGGKFLVGVGDVDLDIKSNDMVIFPGYSLHTVTPMTMQADSIPWRSGRFSITNFLTYNGTR